MTGNLAVGLANRRRMMWSAGAALYVAFTALGLRPLALGWSRHRP